MSFLNVILSSEFAKQIENDAIEAGKQLLQGMESEIEKDVGEFVKMAIPAITRYATLLISKQISLDEFKSLLMGMVDLAQLTSLTLAGNSAEKIDDVKNAWVKIGSNLAIGAVSKIL